jgi:hypothetical protein
LQWWTRREWKERPHTTAHVTFVTDVALTNWLPFEAACFLGAGYLAMRQIEEIVNAQDRLRIEARARLSICRRQYYGKGNRIPQFDASL